MQIVEYPMLPPGKCLECGSGGRDRKYADTGLSVEFYGVVYLCELCLADWASKFGLGQVSDLHETINSLTLRLEKVEDERDSLLGVVRAFDYPNSTDFKQYDLLSGSSNQG